MPGRWSPRGHYAQQRRQVAPAPAPAADDWLRRFGIDAPPVNQPPAHHNWRQNFAPGDFLPLNYDVEAPYVQDHMRHIEQRANRGAPRQPAVQVPNPIQVAIFNQPVPAIGNGALAMDEYLRLHPPVGIGHAPAQPAPMYLVGHVLPLGHLAVANGRFLLPNCIMLLLPSVTCLLDQLLLLLEVNLSWSILHGHCESSCF